MSPEERIEADYEQAMHMRYRLQVQLERAISEGRAEQAARLAHATARAATREKRREYELRDAFDCRSYPV